MSLVQKKIIFISISLLLYLAALFMPGYTHFTTWSYGETLPGWECIGLGLCTSEWISKFMNPFPFISWLSNLPFVVGLIILLFARRRKGFKVASVFLLVAFCMALGSLICYPYPLKFYPQPGCITWLASQFMMFTGAFLLKRETTIPPSELFI